MKVVSSILFPLTVLFIQWLIRHISQVEFNTVGITLGAIGLGQIFPFIIFETLIMGKIISIKANYSFTESEFITKYQFLLSREGKNIDNLKKLTYLLFVVNLLLFILIVYLGSTGEVWPHIILGILSCVISGFYLLVA